MGIEGMNGAGLGGLEAFQRLRAQAREKLAPPSAASAASANAQAASGQKTFSAGDLFKWPIANQPTSQPAIPAGLPAGSVAKTRGPEALQSAFAAAKAEVLKTAVSYQRTGETNKAQSAPRLGQYVDLVA